MIQVGKFIWIAGVIAVLLPTAMHAQFDRGVEQTVLNQLNATRQSMGLSALKPNSELLQAARQHSLLMSKQHKLSHQLSNEPDVQQRIAATGLHYTRSGENVGYNEDQTQIHAAFMNSPPHRANMLTPEYDSVGIGVVQQGNMYWVTEDFATMMDELTPAEAEAEASKALAQVRKQHGLPALGRVDVPQLHDTVCDMAKSGTMNNKSLLQTPKVRYTMTYTNGNPGSLPAEIKRVAGQSELTHFAVGSCFVQSNNDPGGIFWTVLMFFQ